MHFTKKAHKKELPINKGTDRIVPKKIIQTITKYYNRSQLLGIYRSYFQKNLKKFDLDLPKDGPEVKLSTHALTQALGVMFIDQKKFEKFINLFEQDVKNILMDIVWDNSVFSVRELDKKNTEKILHISKKKGFSGKKTISITINDKYKIFQFDEKNKRGIIDKKIVDYDIFLPHEISLLFKQYLPAPTCTHLLPVAHKIKTSYIFEDNERILSKMRLICANISQGNISYTRAGNPTKKSIRQFASYCDIIEYYDNPIFFEIEFLRTNLIINFIVASINKDFENSLTYLKKRFSDFFNNKDILSYKLHSLLLHVKGLGYLQNGYSADSILKSEKKVRKSILKLLKGLSTSQWTPINHILNSAKNEQIDLEIIEKMDASRYIYFQSDYGQENIYRYTSKMVNVSYNNYNEVVLLPFIKATMFFLASFGVLDIAYDYPENKSYKQRYHDFLSIFDGLKFVRITEFGKFIIGDKEDYQQKSNEDDEGQIELNDNKLIANITGDDPMKHIILNQIGEPVNKSCYKINYQSFLKSCNSAQDIYQKIANFKEQISDDPPEIWKDFLNDIQKKINPLKEFDIVRVFEVKQDEGLISIIATDEILKKYIIKAQDLKIIIKIKDIKNVKNRLESLGYFVDVL